MNPKPSFMTSTFSMATLIVVLGLTALAFWTKDTAILKDLAFLMLGGYGVKKGTEIKANGSAPPKVP